MGKYAVPILVIAGTIVGAFFGNPELGALIGGIAGQLLFPTQLPTQYGPKLSDTQSTASNVGAPIPRGWGTFPSGGCVIVKTDLVETIQTIHQGKGGPQQTTENPQYHQTFAIGINDGLISGIRVIWANGKAIYDRRPKGFDDTSGPAETDTAYKARMAASDQLESEFTLYLGTESQLPDPYLEAFYGVGNISAFRGLAYICFHNWLNKAEDGNRMPSQWKFEVYISGLRTGDSPYIYDIPMVIPWVSGSVPWSGPNDGTEFIFGPVCFPNGESFFTPDFNTFEEACAALDRYLNTPTFPVSPPTNTDYAPGRPSFNNIMGVNAYPKGYMSSPPNFLNTTPGGKDMGDPAFKDNNFAYIAVNSLKAAGGTVLLNLDNATIQALPFDVIYKYDLGTVSGIVMHVANEAIAITQGVNWDGGNDLGDGTWGLGARNRYIRVVRLFVPPVDPCLGRPDVPGASDYCVTALGEITSRAEWELQTLANGNQLRIANAQQGINAAPDISVVGVGPLLVDGDPNDNEAYWTNQYNAAVIRGAMPPGLVYGGDYPHLTNLYYRRPAVATGTILTDDVALSTIVGDICTDAGLSGFIDVHLLTQRVQGYVRTSVNPARGAIDPLRQAYFFDGVESGGKLVFRNRGADVAFTLTEDDLAAQVINDNDPGNNDPSQNSRMKVLDTDDMQLPAQVRVHYLSATRDYEAGEQDSPYRTDTVAINIVDVQLPIVLTDDAAMQIAQSLWAQSWVERTSFNTVVDSYLQQLEAADPIAIPVDGLAVRARITQISEALPATRSLQLVADEAAAFVSYAISNPSVPVPRPVLSISLPAAAKYLDLPMLFTEDNDAGFYMAIYGQVPSEFTGAAVYRSIDGGGSYTRIAQQGPPSVVIGTMSQPLAAGPFDIFDEESELFCELVDVDGALFSATEDDVINSFANGIAVGVDGRWEILQYKNAEQVSTGQGTNIWKLTGLLRGRRGTEWVIGSSVTGDQFISLEGITRVPLGNELIGNPFLYKIVSNGGLIDGTAPDTFTDNAMALKPFSVCNVEATRNTPSTNDWSFIWIRRDRVGQTLQGHEIPMSETIETYEIDILSGSTVKRTLTVTGQTYIVYDAADQVTDFGSHQSTVTIRIYQMSLIVGRGIGTDPLTFTG